jgi:hypothetical protein
MHISNSIRYDLKGRVFLPVEMNIELLLSPLVKAKSCQPFWPLHLVDTTDKQLATELPLTITRRIS